MQPNSIWNQSTMPWVITAIIALIAPLVSFYVANRGFKNAFKTISHQAGLTLMSGNRQQWINELRSQLGEFIAAIKLVNIGLQELRAEKVDYELYEKMLIGKNIIYLLVNPEIVEHNRLLTDIHSILQKLDGQILKKDVENIAIYNGEMITLADSVIDSGRKVLYGEWSKIQNHINNAK